MALPLILPGVMYLGVLWRRGVHNRVRADVAAAVAELLIALR